MLFTVIIAVQFCGETARIKISVQIIHGCLHIDIRMPKQHLEPGLKVGQQFIRTGIRVISCFYRIRQIRVIPLSQIVIIQNRGDVTSSPASRRYRAVCWKGMENTSLGFDAFTEQAGKSIWVYK